MDDYVIFDIETDSLNTETAKIVCIGVYTSWNKKTHCLWEKDFHKFRQMFWKAKFVIGFNSDRFDLPIIMNKTNNIFHSDDVFKFKSIDLYTVVKQRQSMFDVNFNESDENSKGGFSLDNICYKLGLSRKQAGFDYKLLQKPIGDMTVKEISYIEKYTKRDITITDELYLHVNDLFSGFRHYLPEKDIKRKSDMRSSSGSLAYKIVCNLAGLKEEYTDTDEPTSYKGGYVMTPVLEEAKGKIHVLDLASAYPHAYMFGNLYTQCKFCKTECDKRFTGGTAFKTPLKLNGAYCTKYGMGRIETVIKEMYAERIEAKQKAKTDIRYNNIQKALKIVLNTIYGISGSRKFKNVYDVNTAQDCTLIGRYFIKMLRKHLTDNGYTIIYVDTDSNFVIDPFNDTAKLMAHVADYITEIKSIFPFPQETFDVELEEDIKYMQFFKDSKNKFIKKRYIYLTTDNEVTVKGLSVIRGDSSMVSRNIWKDRVIPHITTNETCKVSINTMKSWVKEALDENIALAAVEFKVKDYDEYKNKSQIQAQISKELSEGIHYLVKTRRNYGIGLSKNARYCTIEDAKKDGIGVFNMTRINSDLSPFVLNDIVSFDKFKSEEEKNMFEF